MAKEDTSSGLLSKVVKFVRNPATSWSDLDSKGTDREEALSKQLLKEMIERKRRNDFVRKREFDMLRKLRKREAMVGQDAEGARPSFFQSSMPSKPDDRANTLKKIDEIEAQMSMQWWKTKHGSQHSVQSSDISIGESVRSLDASPSMPLRPSASLASNAPISPISPIALSANRPIPNAYERTAPFSLEFLKESADRNPAELPGQAAGAASPPPLLRSVPQLTEVVASLQDAAPARSAPARTPMVAQAPAQAPLLGGLTGLGGGGGKVSSGFSPSRIMAVEVAEVAHDAELEEASIRFANGDNAGAEAGLLEMLLPGAARVCDPETWMALFDLYRATAQQEKFENAALQFAARFDRSAPQWFSMPDMVQQLAVSDKSRFVAGGRVADWTCPSAMGTQTIAALKVALSKLPMPWRLDWSKLKTLEALAVDPLLKLFAYWAQESVQLRFIGAKQLSQVLQAATPSNENQTPQEWWQLRMEFLRVIHRPDEFELVALDFCVTYEVSPPAWESARCEYKSLDQDGGTLGLNTFIGEPYRDSAQSPNSVLYGDSQMDISHSQLNNYVSIELSGIVEGDAIAVLDELDTKVSGADVILISCAKLIRVDFSAAGTLLNWVNARQGECRSVQFSEVNRLVAAFFNVIGITESSAVTLRVD
jgi:ABC-type transporter Mla MlaB component